MKRSALESLRELHWIKVPGDPLECGIVPSAAAEVANLLLGPTEDSTVRRICTRLFVDFRGYTEEDGRPIPNTIDARMQLYGWLDCLQAVNAAAHRLQQEAAEGEGSAVSESLVSV